MTSSNTRSTIVNELYKSRLNLLEQLKRQGYDVHNEMGAGVNEIVSMYETQQLHMTLTTVDTGAGATAPKRRVRVHYALEGGLRQAGLANLVDLYFGIEGSLSPQTDSLVVLVRTHRDINGTLAEKVVEFWESSRIFVTLQSLDRLQYQILDHKYVPPHRIMTPEETASLVTQFKLPGNGKGLPNISRNDPVAKAIGIRPGEVCEILRPSKTAIVAKYYRVCVNE